MAKRKDWISCPSCGDEFKVIYSTTSSCTIPQYCCTCGTAFEEDDDTDSDDAFEDYDE